MSSEWKLESGNLMHDELKNLRFSVKPLPSVGPRPVELARSLAVHPLTYQELPFDPEYSIYAGRLTPEFLNNASPDEMYWKVRREIIYRHTGERPYEISGPHAEEFLQYLFPRDVSKVKPGRCSYQFACYHEGGMITDGVLLRFTQDRFWLAQADGDLFNWYRAFAHQFDVSIHDPHVWVSQIQGPRSMELLGKLLNRAMPNPWRYFDWAEVTMSGERVIISRTGFTNELGWEIYFRPENNIEFLGDLILELGKEMGMILTATPGFRCRRIEAGLLSSGQDFDQTTTPFAIGLGRFVNFDKGDFIGRKALISADTRSCTWGIRVVDGIGIRGRSLLKCGAPVGRMTSSTWSPYQNCGVGIVHLDSPEFRAGDFLEVQCTDDEVHTGELCTLPMYDPLGAIVRGKVVDIPDRPVPWSGLSAQP